MLNPPNSPKELIERYLAERYELMRISIVKSAPFRQRYYSDAYLEKRNREDDRQQTFWKLVPPLVTSVAENTDKATIKTIEPLGTETENRIYDLVRTGTGWKISRRGRECFLCHGAGMDDYVPCDYCDGTGWKFTP